MLQSKLSRQKRGLTLIELVFVVAILAILAGFLVPRLGTLRNLAGYAGNADQAKSALEQAFLYNLTVGHYPGGLDSLTLPADTLYTGPKGYLDPALSASLEVVSLDAGALKSVNTQITADSTGATGAKFFKHDIVNAAGDSATVSYQLAGSDGTTITGANVKIARVKLPVAADVTADANNYEIYKGIYGISKLDAVTGAPTDGTYLIAAGFGLNSELNGRTSIGAPQLFTRDPLAYNRAVELLKVYPTGTTNAAGAGAPPERLAR